MGPTWGPPGSFRSQMGPTLATWILLSGQLWPVFPFHVCLCRRSHKIRTWFCRAVFSQCPIFLSKLMRFLSPYASLTVCGMQILTYFRHHKYQTKIIIISWNFHVDWHRLASKLSGANAGTYANIDQGLISNMGLNHMQYAVFTSNQSNDK